MDSLTEKEWLALGAINELNYAEYGFSDYDAGDVASKTGLSIKSIRGIIGSLVKKNLLWIEDFEELGWKKIRGGYGYGFDVVKVHHLIHLTDDGYTLLGRGGEIE